MHICNRCMLAVNAVKKYQQTWRLRSGTYTIIKVALKVNSSFLSGRSLQKHSKCHSIGVTVLIEEEQQRNSEAL